MAWRPPKYDGGAEVTQYVLESRMIGRDNFVRVGGETKLMDRKFTLTGLKEGSSHEFRVSAVNQVGQGKPSFATKPVQCKDELGEWRRPPGAAGFPFVPRSLQGSSAEQQVWVTDLSPVPPEPPTLELDIRDKLMVKVGDSCTVSGRFSGRPVPALTWTKNGEELKADEQIQLHSTAHHLSLTLSKARREDSGCYGVKVENAAGSRSGACTITVVGKAPLSACSPTPLAT